MVTQFMIKWMLKWKDYSQWKLCRDVFTECSLSCGQKWHKGSCRRHPMWYSRFNASLQSQSLKGVSNLWNGLWNGLIEWTDRMDWWNGISANQNCQNSLLWPWWSCKYRLAIARSTGLLCPASVF